MSEASGGWLKIRRVDPEGTGVWIVREAARELMRLDPGEASSVLVDPGVLTGLRIEVEGHQGELPELDVPEGATVTLAVSPGRQTLPQRLMGRLAPLSAELVVESAPPERTVTAQFWAGNATDKDAF